MSTDTRSTTSKPQLPRIALIGVSGYASVFVDLLLSENNAKRYDFVGVVVLPHEQSLESVTLLRSHNIKQFDSYINLLEAEKGKLDLCIIPTGIQWHSRMAIAALEAGTNVLVEKPLAGSLIDAEAIIQAEKRTGRWVAVGFQDIYTKEVKWLKDRLLDGAIGRIKSIGMVGLWPRSNDYYTRNNWAGRLFVDGAAAMDSPLNNALAHFVNLALYLSGSESGSSCDTDVTEAELFRSHTIEGFDTAVVKANNRAGTDYWFGVSHACEISREPEIHIEGETGHAAWLHDKHCFIAPDGGEKLVSTVPDYEMARQQMLDAILKKLQDPTFSICDTSIAINHSRFIHNLTEGWRTQTIETHLIQHMRIAGHENPIPAIRGLGKYIDLAWLKRSLLSEVGFPTLETPSDF